MTDTANLGLPFIEASQAQKHVTHNEALRILDAAIQITVLDMTRTAPPSSPVEGERHVVAASPTGAWAGHAKAIATRQDGAWAFLAAKTGWCVWSVADNGVMVFDGTQWRDLRGLAFDGLAHVGVNTTATTPNLLSVKSNADLFAAINAADGGTGDVRMQLSKESAAKTASVYFSDAYSGRAEFGLVGSDALKLKVSADGAAWVDAMSIDQTSGNTTLPRGLSLGGVIAPPQITANQNDYAPTGTAAAAVVQLTTDAARSLSGLAGGAEGRIVSLINIGSQTLTLLDENTSSTAANRFTLGGDLAVTAKQAVLLRYDGPSARWQAISRSASTPVGFLLAANNLSDVASKPTARSNLGVRDVLAADRIYYVRTDGSDSNTGLANASGSAFLTIQKAINTVAALDLSIYNVTINVGSGTYAGSVKVTAAWVGSGVVTLVGDTTTPANVIISTTSADAINVDGFGSRLSVKGFRVQTTTGGIGISASNGGLINVTDKMDFGVTAGEHLRAQTGGVINIKSISYSISGSPGAGTHLTASPQGTINCFATTITLTANINTANGFAAADRLSFINGFGMTFTLGGFTVTGKRYDVESGAVIFTSGAGTSYFPGSVAGVGTNPGTAPYGLYN